MLRGGGSDLSAGVWWVWVRIMEYAMILMSLVEFRMDDLYVYM